MTSAAGMLKGKVEGGRGGGGKRRDLVTLLASIGLCVAGVEMQRG